jgi:hypothetical protein
VEEELSGLVVVQTWERQEHKVEVVGQPKWMLVVELR